LEKAIAQALLLPEDRPAPNTVAIVNRAIRYL